MLCLRGNFDGVRHRPCPLAGKRAPELATGALIKAFDGIAAEAQQIVLHKCATGQLSPEDVGMVVADFSLGLERQKHTILVKTSHWREFPWRLCSLSHWDMTIARKEAANAIIDFDATAQSQAAHHRITWSWLHADSAIREQIQSFSRGESLANLPLLEQRLAELALVPTAERRQEGDHGLIERYVKAKVSPSYISLVLRRPEIEDICRSDDGMNSFLDILEKCVNPREMATALSLDKHPLWLRGIAENKNRSAMLTILACILYSLDADAQYLALSAAKKKRERYAKFHGHASKATKVICYKP